MLFFKGNFPQVPPPNIAPTTFTLVRTKPGIIHCGDICTPKTAYFRRFKICTVWFDFNDLETTSSTLRYSFPGKNGILHQLGKNRSKIQISYFTGDGTLDCDTACFASIG